MRSDPVEREPEIQPDDEELDLFGDPESIDGSIEDDLDELLEEERHPD
jgi:hypothetical protein